MSRTGGFKKSLPKGYGEQNNIETSHVFHGVQENILTKSREFFYGTFTKLYLEQVRLFSKSLGNIGFVQGFEGKKAFIESLFRGSIGVVR